VFSCKPVSLVNVTVFKCTLELFYSDNLSMCKHVNASLNYRSIVLNKSISFMLLL